MEITLETLRMVWAEDPERLLAVLATLTPREEKMVKMRIGANETNLTDDEIARWWYRRQGSYTTTLKSWKARVPQIIAKALRKLNHPSRRNKIFPPAPFEIWQPARALESKAHA